MNVVIRADASPSLGAGHVMRCLTLADALRERSHRVQFFCRQTPGNLINLIQTHGFHVHALPLKGDDAQLTLDAVGSQKPDWVVVDHYDIDARWETCLRPRARRLLVIDDAPQRQHDCDALLDQNLRENGAESYRSWVPKKATLWLGPSFALIRTEFRRAREHAHIHSRPFLRRLLVSMGGSDPQNGCGLALDAVQQWKKADAIIDLVAGPQNQRQAELEARCRQMSVRFYRSTDTMGLMMAEADCAVGAAGSSTWERACVGLPGIMVAQSPNQEPIGEHAQKAGIAVYLGRIQETSAQDLCDALADLDHHSETLQAMSLRARQLVDGEGSRRVVEAMETQGAI